MTPKRRSKKIIYVYDPQTHVCAATPKNPWVEHTSFQAGIKQDNPSAHPIIPRSMLVHLYPKETRRMPLQNLVSFSMNQLQQPVNFR